MRTYLLVHGAWHGSWCWHKTVPLLERAGEKTLAPDLSAVATLEEWTQTVCGFLEGAPEPVILVGHSRGGIVISQAAERLPGKVRELVYLSGFLLRQGESVLRVLREEGSSPLLRRASLSADKRSWVLDEPAIGELFYNDCSDEDVAFATARTTHEPAEPMMTPVRITPERFGRVPRVYIECLRDRAVPLTLQRAMHAALPCRVLSLDTDHSPFFSAPDELARLLLAL